MKQILTALVLVALLCVTTAPAFSEMDCPPARAIEDACEEPGAVALVGCSPAQKTALRNAANEKGMCLASCASDQLTQPAEVIVKSCGAQCAMPTGDDLKWFLDFIAGQKAAAMRAGAHLPNDPDPTAGTGYHPKAMSSDAGSQ